MRTVSLLLAVVLLALGGYNGVSASEPAQPAGGGPVAATGTRPAASLPARDKLDITGAQVRALRAAGVDFLLIDCRQPSEMAQGRIAGSVLIPKTKLDQYLPLLELDKDRPMVIYCTVGARSAGMATDLRAKGFPAVWSLQGGIRDWKHDMEPATTQP